MFRVNLSCWILIIWKFRIRTIARSGGIRRARKRKLSGLSCIRNLRMTSFDSSMLLGSYPQQISWVKCMYSSCYNRFIDLGLFMFSIYQSICDLHNWGSGTLNLVSTCWKLEDLLTFDGLLGILGFIGIHSTLSPGCSLFKRQEYKLFAIPGLLRSLLARMSILGSHKRCLS